MNDVVCPRCKAQSAMRINRTSFLERRIYPLFGYYPWKCGGCGSTFLYRFKGNKIRRRKSDKSSEAA
jgi:transposase-like protein